LALTLDISAGRIRLSDTTGHAVLDTDERLFHQTDYLAGSITIPARSSGVGSNVDVSRVMALGGCSADATHVIGAFQVVFPGTSNPSGVPGFGWFNVGGSYLHWFDGSSLTSAGLANDPYTKSELTQFSLYTYRVAAGQFLLDEWVRIAGYTNGGWGLSYTMNSFVMNYRLRAGLFT
jgi:hypothetical protein